MFCFRSTWCKVGGLGVCCVPSITSQDSFFHERPHAVSFTEECEIMLSNAELTEAKPPTAQRLEVKGGRDSCKEAYYLPLEGLFWTLPGYSSKQNKSVIECRTFSTSMMYLLPDD